MSIYISPVIITVVFNLLLWPLILFLFLALIKWVIRHLIYTLKNRQIFWVVIAFLTTRKQQDKAEQYTLRQFDQLRYRLSKENPKFLSKIQEVFNSKD